MNQRKEYGSLGEFLREYRKGKAMTQEQFSSIIGIDRSNYSLIECSRKSVGVKTVAAIAKATKKSTAFISGLNQKQKQ